MSRPILPDAVVFDCDGLLIDTERAWVSAERAVFERRGHGFTAEDRRLLLGTSPLDAGRVLEVRLALPGQATALADELLELVAESLPRLAVPRPGVQQLVRALKGRLPMGVASNTPVRLVQAGLSRVGLKSAFSVIVGVDEVSAGKPAPDVYETACRRLSRHPSVVVAFEDSPVGVQAARAAGLFVIGVPSVESVTLEADLVVDSLGDLRVWSRLGLV